LTEARGDFDGLVPLLVEKIARTIRAVDGRRPVAVVASPNDRGVLGMTLRRLADEPPKGGTSRRERREVSSSDYASDDATMRVFTAMDAALGPHRHGEDASFFKVDARATTTTTTTQLAHHHRKAFSHDAKFAGDVDVDDTELRCAKRDWDSEHEGVEHGARDDVASGGGGSAATRARRPSSFGAVVVAWDGADASIFERYLSSAHRESSRRHHKMLDVVAVDAPAMLADFGDYGEVRALDSASVARLRAADVVVLHHACLLPTRAAAEAVERRVIDAIDAAVRPIVVKTKSRCEKTERLHRYAGASPAHEWTPPPSRLRGVRVVGVTACGGGGGDGRRRGLARLLRSLVAPADPESDVNGYGLRLRKTGRVIDVFACDGDAEGAEGAEGTDEGAESGRSGAFKREFLARVVARFRETHASSGDVGGAEVKMVMSERDAWRLLTGGSRDRILDGLNFLSAADPLVLRFALEVETNGGGDEDGLTSRLRRHLARRNS